MSETSSKTIGVYVRDICFSYNKSQSILNGINLVINSGVICGLLGASGCGKTTLLKCILGRLTPKSGVIKIFGNVPGSSESHIPGAGVGYMPQELSLYNEFTIEEILTYFGRIYGMNCNEIKEKVKELTKLLQLSDKNKLIGQHSGGQQRRISLSCALIHSPPLLILDEPTVGTDSLLRRDIWHHLVSLSNCGHTIIVTTHYIEEARNSNIVAFLRSGKILAEDEPNLLLNKYESNNLEEVFLKLCELKNTETENTNNEINCYENTVDIRKPESNVISISYNRDNSEINLNKPKIAVNVRKTQSIDRFSVILLKNLKRIIRNYTHLIFEVLLPTLILIIVLGFMGRYPKNLTLAVFNGENSTTDNWGQLFIKNIDKTKLNPFYFDSSEEAIDSVKSGHNIAAIDISDRFTKALRLRFMYRTDTDDQILEDSQIFVSTDMSNHFIGRYVRRYLAQTMIAFAQQLANVSSINSKSLTIPLAFEPPIYGDTSQTIKDFMLPSFYIISMYATPASIASHMLYEERRNGLLERSLVAGVTASEFLISLFVTQFVLVCLQTFSILILPYILLDIHIMGSATLVIAMLISQGICGIAWGIVTASISSDVVLILLLQILNTMTMMGAAGFSWPIENMPNYMRPFSNILPNTLPLQSLRNIMYRQWTIDYFEVYIGFVVTYVWFLFFILISFIFLRKHF